MEIKRKVQKVTILQGIPASGKSTYAREQALANPKEVVIVNRDDIRDSLGKYWVPERENLDPSEDLIGKFLYEVRFIDAHEDYPGEKLVSISFAYGGGQ